MGIEDAVVRDVASSLLSFGCVPAYTDTIYISTSFAVVCRLTYNGLLVLTLKMWMTKYKHFCTVKCCVLISAMHCCEISLPCAMTASLHSRAHRILQAAAARTIHAHTLVSARTAFQEYLTMLLSLARQLHLKASSSPNKPNQYAHVDSTTSANDKTSSFELKKNAFDTDASPEFDKCTETQRQLLQALQGTITLSSARHSVGSGSYIGLYKPAWALSTCAQWQNYSGMALIYALNNHRQASVRCGLECLQHKLSSGIHIIIIFSECCTNLLVFLDFAIPTTSAV